MVHLAANVMRNIATVLTLAAERIDPQPPVEWTQANHFDAVKCTGTTADGAKIQFYRTG